MTEAFARSFIGVSLLVAQILIIFFIGIFYARGGLIFEDLTMALAIIVPMFSVHTTVIFKYMIVHRSDPLRTSPKVNLPFVILSFLIAIAFAVYMAGVVVLKSMGIAFAPVEHMKWALGLGEVFFGVYLGIFVGALFGESHQ